MSSRKLYFALDLHDDPALIAEYEQWHRADNIWPEVLEGLKARGVKDLELFRCGNRLIQVLEIDTQSAAAATESDEALEETMEEWEQLMWRFQLALPFAAPGEKWVPMRRIFSFKRALLGQDCEPAE